MNHKEIINKRFRKALERRGLADMDLVRGNGYFYWTSYSNKELRSLINKSGRENVIVNWFYQLSITQWVDIAEYIYLMVDGKYTSKDKTGGK